MVGGLLWVVALRRPYRIHMGLVVGVGVVCVWLLADSVAGVVIVGCVVGVLGGLCG